MNSSTHLIRSLLFAGLTSTFAHAAPITWSVPVAPATAGDTITDGSLVIAENSADPNAVTINTVPFAANPGGPGGSNADGTFYGVDAGDPGLNELLDSHSYQAGGFSFQISGLTIGNIYRIQIWTVGDTRTCCAAREQRYGDGEAAQSYTPFMRRDSGGAVVGTWLADAATQTITVEGATDPGLSGYQVRDTGSDTDGDGLTNLQEVNGLNGSDVSHGFGATDPESTDSDGDGLSDSEEVDSAPVTNPNSADTDGDGFNDNTEIDLGTDPLDSNDVPFVPIVSIIGGLLTSDLTDPENDGVEGANPANPADWAALLNWNWADISSSSESNFHGFGSNEAAYDVFDNTIGGGGAKWCCDAPPQNITVRFAGPTVLTHFTLTSSNDSPQRDPRVFAIEGSNDGTTFTPIYSRTDSGSSFWGSNRNQTARVDLPAPSAAYEYIRYHVTATGSATQHALAEIEYFGEIDPVDTDGGGLLDIYENLLGLDINNAADDTSDLDGDGLNNVEEAAAATNPKGADTDNDGLDDGLEINTYGSNPLVQDSDGDGLTDGDEVNTHGSDPTLVDSDGDGFDDPVEVAEGSDPALPGSVPNLTLITSLGTGAGALLGGDITDPENDGLQGAGDGLHFDWTTVSSSSETYFGGTGGNPGEGALDIWDNEVGTGSAKWCCDPAPQWSAVSFKTPHSLTHFTVTSGNDTPDRDPNDWAIQGSNDGVNWSDIYPAPTTNDPTYLGSPWTQRNEVIRFDLPAPTPFYTHFRYFVNQVRGPSFALHQLNEIELFGTPDTTDTDGDGIPDWYENQYAFLDPGNSADALLDQDSDGTNNFAEFAHCLDPESSDPVLVVAGEELTPSGREVIEIETLPTDVNICILFQRIRDPQNYNLVYTVQFSHDMAPGSWEDATDSGTVVADANAALLANGGAEAVKVNYPFFLSTGRKARFARVAVTVGP